ncbi:thermonuclease family protein [Oceanicoccus sagamiensis]|uniref:thermonuclease family protein n=1 Tax=Oceanicoccus sagamiensis TaxID=716816 RepID=UPI00146F7147|nr:thermonuclease family protein [Oceanicoccus sagamiensis]
MPAVAAELCAASGKIEWAQIKKIVDGDTLHLRDGRKVRVMGINSPEIGYRKKDDPGYPQPLAMAAKQAAENFFSSGSKVGLRFGELRVDHYGRVLAHVYRADGASLSAHLLSQGLAWHVVVPPNVSGWQCLQAVEIAAKKQSAGLWGHLAYPTKQANHLSMNDTGFQQITGKVVAVNRTRGGWWVQLGQLAVRVQDKHLKYLDDVTPQDWLHQTLTLRGWVIDRSQSSAVKKKGYSALMINLQHSAMLK